MIGVNTRREAEIFHLVIIKISGHGQLGSGLPVKLNPRLEVRLANRQGQASPFHVAGNRQVEPRMKQYFEGCKIIPAVPPYMMAEDMVLIGIPGIIYIMSIPNGSIAFAGAQAVTEIRVFRT